MLNNVSIVIPVAPGETAHQDLLTVLNTTGAEIIISDAGPRAQNLNEGAARATKTFIWFLHADSTITNHNITALAEALKENPTALHYFDIAFDKNGIITLNARGANLRSRWFGLPYGDQGFCIAQKLFTAVGPYPEDVPYGEDLLFIRHCRRAGLKLNAISSIMVTSARKYETQGWLYLTTLRQWQLMKLLTQRLS